MTNDNPPADRRSIVVAYSLAWPPEKVWRALTEPDLLAKWLMPSDIKPIVGHKFTFRTQPMPGFDGIVHCEVTIADQPRRFAYTWRGGQLDTTVTWTLNPSAAGGTQLHLEHAGFRPEDGMTYDILSQGWRQKATASLADVLEALE